MFCTHCGNQLPEDSRFCVFCGRALEAAPVADTPVPPVEQPPAPVEAPVVQTSLAEDSFINVVAVEEATYETPYMATSDYAPPVRTPPKKKKKTGVIIAIVLVVVLLAGAAGGVWFYLDHKNTVAYEDAVAMLEAGDISGALTAFEDLGDYEDSAKMVKNLKKYQEAVKLLDAHKYDEALEIFTDLGKFHDSKTYVESGVDYHKAKYLMGCAARSDVAGLELLPLGESIAESGDPRTISNELYFAAAEIFEELDGYLDSDDLASECWYEMALIELDWGNSEAALEIQERLNDEDAANLQSAIVSGSADTTLLTDLETALRIWLDEEDAYSALEELEKAYTHLQIYEDLYFLDSRLEELYGDFMEALEDQMDTLDASGDVEDWVDYYQSLADMFQVCETLYEEYGFLKGSSWEDDFIGIYDTLAKYPTIEASLTEQMANVTAPWSEENEYYYAPYTNDTGVDFTLHITIQFFDGNTYLEDGDEVTLSVPAGETIEIPLVPKTLKDGEFDGWDATWWFELG